MRACFRGTKAQNEFAQKEDHNDKIGKIKIIKKADRVKNPVGFFSIDFGEKENNNIASKYEMRHITDDRKGYRQTAPRM